MSKVRVGIIGAGKVGNIRLRLLQEMENVEVVGIYDTKNKNEKIENTKYMNKFDDFKKLKLDAVFICCYVSDLARYTAWSLEHVGRVFCEKPPALTQDDLKKVKSLYDPRIHILKYGFNHRYHHSVQNLKNKISTEKAGKIIWMRGVYGKAGSIDFLKNWRNYKKFSGGGILIDQGIHMIDLFRFFLEDELEVVSAIGGALYWDIESEDNVMALLKGKKTGAIVSLHSSATFWKHQFKLEVGHENLQSELSGILSSTMSYAPETNAIWSRGTQDDKIRMGNPIMESAIFDVDESWKYEIQEFMNAKTSADIRMGTIDDAWETIGLVDKIYEKLEAKT